MKSMDIRLIFINGFLGGAILSMVSFLGMFRDNPEHRLFFGVLMGVTALVSGCVFQFCYEELRATNGLRWIFEKSEGKIPERIFEVNGRQVEQTLAYLAGIQLQLRRNGRIILGLNLLKLMTTLLSALALARWQDPMLIFTLIWTGLSHVWIYVVSVRSLKNGQFTQMEIYSLLELHRFSLKRKV